MKHYVVWAGILAGLGQVTGAYWDAAYHIRWGRDTFFSPPHILIFGGIALVAVVALFALRAGRAPALRLVFWACVAELLAAPFDELWHRLFGKDVSAWSPPHLILILAGAAVMFAVVRLRMEEVGGRFDLAATLAGSLGLALLAISVVEWEVTASLPDSHPFWARPPWLYPSILVFSLAFTSTALTLATGSTGAGTLAAAALTLIRLGTMAALHATGYTATTAPPPLIAGAIGYDVCLAWYQFQTGHSHPPAHDPRGAVFAALGGAFLFFAVLAQHIALFGGPDRLSAAYLFRWVAVGGLAGFAGALAGWQAGLRLRPPAG